MNKDELIRMKNKIKRGYIWQVVFFSAAVAVLSSFLILSFSKQLHYILIAVLLILCSVFFPAAFLGILCFLIKKERKLKFINIFLCSYQYFLNLLFVVSLYFWFYNRETRIQDLGAIVSFYSISWAILGITITLFGVWLSLNSSRLMNRGETDSYDTNSYKFNSIIGLVFTFASIVLNLVLLLSGLSYFALGTYAEHPSFYIGLVYVSSYTILNMTTFLFLPAIIKIAGNSSRFNKSLLEYCGETIKTIELYEQTTEMISLLNRIIESIKNVTNDSDSRPQ